VKQTQHFTRHIAKQVGSGCNTTGLYMGGAQFRSWLGRWLSWLRFAWFLSIHPVRCQDSILPLPCTFRVIILYHLVIQCYIFSVMESLNKLETVLLIQLQGFWTLPIIWYSKKLENTMIQKLVCFCHLIWAQKHTKFPKLCIP
jgi:hypothetical protein